MRAVDLIIQLNRFLRESQRLLELTDMATGRAHHDPEVHKRFGAQTVRVPPQDVVADFHDIVMATAAEQERRHANAGLRGLILLVQSQRDVARFPIGLQHFFGVVAGHLHLRIAQLHQDFRDPGAIGGGQVRSLGQLLRGLVMRNGFLICAVLLRHIAGSDPVGEGRS